MLLKRVSHSRALPTDITSHQMVSVSSIIHGHVSEAIEPLLETKPKYHAQKEILDTVGQAITQLEGVISLRKIKNPQDLRGRGGMDGRVGARQISRRKKAIYNTRRGHLRRLRQAIQWTIDDIGTPGSDLTPEAIEAAEVMDEILQKRADLFESLNYEESHAECRQFISAIEADTSASGLSMTGTTALALLGQTRLYERFVEAQAAFVAIHKEQTQLDARREESPSLDAARRDLRQAIRALLMSMHFDVANGDETLSVVLGDIDEVIDKARAVGKRRETIAEQKAQQGQNGNTSGGSAPDSTDPTDAPNQTDETDQTDESNAPDASVAPDASTSVPSPQADNAAATETEVAQG